MSGFVNKDEDKRILKDTSRHLTDNEILAIALNRERQTDADREHVNKCADCITILSHVLDGDTTEDVWSYVSDETRTRAKRLRENFLFITNR